MNLFAQLNAIKHMPPRQPAAPHPRLQNLLLGSQAQSARAAKRYEAVMAGKGWLTQRRVESALGYAATVSSRYLAKLLREGVVERRNRDGAKVFSRKSGYEWRWKE